MNPKTSDFRGTLIRAALLTVIATAHAAEQPLDVPTTDITVGPGDTVWVDSSNTVNAPIPLASVNGTPPATGLMPGWAHTQWSFLKYDGTNVLDVPNAEKQQGAVNLENATATSVYYDNQAQTTFAASKSIGLVETTRDFIISNGATLDVALGGLIFHNNSHWMKVGDVSGFLTSSSGQLAVITNGGQPDYQISGVVVKDPNASTPLRFVKTGPDALGVTGVNTYTGGTWINNGRLRTTNVSGYGATGTLVKVTGTNSQACLAAAGTFGQNFEIEGDGWLEAGSRLGALRFEANVTVGGNVAVTGLTRITANTGVTGTINGTFTGDADLDIGFPGGSADRAGTIALNGSAAGFTGMAGIRSGRLDVRNDFGGSIFVIAEAGIGGEGNIAGDLVSGDITPTFLVADGSTTDALAVAGNVDLSLGVTNLTVTGVPATGTSFTAFTYGTLSGPVTNIVPVALRGGTATNDSANKQVLVNYTPGNITWTGATNANWTQNADLNFDSSGATNFFSGDAVSFTEAAAVKAVTLVGMLYPKSVTFDHTTEYNLTGANAGIGGNASITKNGSGTLVLNGQFNTFTGPIAVNAGILKMGNYWEGLGNSSGITIAGGAQLDFAGAYPVSVGRNYAWTIAGNGPDGLGAITNSGAPNVQENAGIRSLTLSANASVGGNAGRFDLGLANGTNSTITGNGYTLTKVGTNSMGFRSDASGSAINFVIAGGAVWAENTDGAWGGTNGTLRVQNGAKGGTYGIRSISTPVTLEGGSTLLNQGGGKATWSGTVTLTGDATIESNAAAIDVTGPLSGTAGLTKIGAQPTLLTNAQYSGNTTITGGVLTLVADNINNNLSTVSISGTGGILDLPSGQTDTVAVLLIDGLPQQIGTHGSTASGADFPDDTRFTGTGKLNVTSAGNAYQTWAASKGIPGEPGTGDYDNDGIPNAIEFVIGGDPRLPDSAALAPTLDNSDPTYVDFTFRRTDESAGDNPYVQYGSDLLGWTKAEPGEPELNPVVINETFDEYGEGIDRVVVRVPRALAQGGKIFVRLAVDIP